MKPKWPRSYQPPARRSARGDQAGRAADFIDSIDPEQTFVRPAELAMGFANLSPTPHWLQRLHSSLAPFQPQTAIYADDRNLAKIAQPR